MAKSKIEYEKSLLFELTDEEYKHILQRDKKKELLNKKKQNSGWTIKLDKRDVEGDGIPELTGYNLSSVWGRISNQMAEFYPYSIPLPSQGNNRSTTFAKKYSRTNLEEIRRVIKTYMRKGDFFLENCCGWSTFSSMAAYYGYNGCGVDIWDTALEYSKKQYKQIKDVPNIGHYEILKADGMNLPFKNNTFDYVYCNPPFLDMEMYSGKENDIANKDLDVFLSNIICLMSENKRVLKDGGLCTITINDKREDGYLVPIQKYIIDCGLDVGFMLHDFVIAENPTGGSMIMRKREYKAQRTAKMHEYVITFINPKLADKPKAGGQKNI